MQLNTSLQKAKFSCEIDNQYLKGPGRLRGTSRKLLDLTKHSDCFQWSTCRDRVNKKIVLSRCFEECRIRREHRCSLVKPSGYVGEVKESY